MCIPVFENKHVKTYKATFYFYNYRMNRKTFILVNTYELMKLDNVHIL